MLVRDVMTEEVVTVRPEATLRQIARLMRDEDIGSVPVEENERLIGIVTDRDIVVRGLANEPPFLQLDARAVMSGRTLYCFADQNIDEVLDNMGDLQVRRMPVVDRDKRLVGVVSIGDLSGGAPLDKAGESLSRISAPASD